MSYGIRALFRNGHIRILAADTKDIVEKARSLHDLFPTSNAALGRVLSIASLMAINLKDENEKIQIEIDGGGPIGLVFVEAKSDGHVKGFVSDSTVYLKYNDTNKLAVGLAVGKDGYLKVTRYNNYKEPFSSRVALRSGEIGDDFAYYFALSEQIPSLVSTGVLVDTDYSTKAAGALIVELLPGHTEEDIVFLENIQKELKPISSLLDSGLKIEDIIELYFKDAQILDKKELSYVCDCNEERFLKGLLTLNDNDLKEVLQDDMITINCEFCNKTYHISKDKLLEYRYSHV